MEVSTSGGSGGQAAQAGTPNQARDYRRLAREAKRTYAGTRHELKRFAELILATVAACAGQNEDRELVTQTQAAMRQGGSDWTACAAALDRILAGERDADALCDALDFDTAMIIEAILAGLRDPETLADLLPAEKTQA